MEAQEASRIKVSGRTWYVSIPARLRRVLKSMGIDVNSLVVWRSLDDSGDRVRLVVEIYKSGVGSGEQGR